MPTLQRKTSIQKLTHDEKAERSSSAPSPIVNERLLNKQKLKEQYLKIRRQTKLLSDMLEVEDQVIQTSEEVSPTKWHLAHTTWFFETMVLKEVSDNFTPFNDQFEYLFNSYYNAVGPQFHRPSRGHLSRPTLKEIWAYRSFVDDQIINWFDKCAEDIWTAMAHIVEIGLHHEQQHQELILTDIKEVLSHNPLHPTPFAPPSSTKSQQDLSDLRWLSYNEGLFQFGHDERTQDSFAYDNEQPLHKHYLNAYELADRPITNGEYRNFMEDGGYTNPMLWLSDGWARCQQMNWSAPHNWHAQEGSQYSYTLYGKAEIDWNAPVTHISYYEANAYATWAGQRLPTEFEWEHAANSAYAPTPQSGNLFDFEVQINNKLTAPQPLEIQQQEPTSSPPLRQLFGDVWEWTSSPYTPYPGFNQPNGALGEYNGKFMCDQHVLRGGSCATPRDHIRATYRNFFPAWARWQFSGLRLARDAF